MAETPTNAPVSGNKHVARAGGREDVLRKLCDLANNRGPERPLVWLRAPRRFGKTSCYFEIERRLASDSVVCVRVSCKLVASGQASFASELVGAITSAVQKRGVPAEEKGSEAPQRTEQESEVSRLPRMLAAVEEALPGDERLLLFFDDVTNVESLPEFVALRNWLRDGGTSGVMVIAGTPRFHSDPRNSDFLAGAHILHLAPFTEDEVEAFCRRYGIDESHRKDVWTSTGGHPALLQVQAYRHQRPPGWQARAREEESDCLAEIRHACDENLFGTRAPESRAWLERCARAGSKGVTDRPPEHFVVSGLAELLWSQQTGSAWRIPGEALRRAALEWIGRASGDDGARWIEELSNVKEIELRILKAYNSVAPSPMSLKEAGKIAHCAPQTVGRYVRAIIEKFGEETLLCEGPKRGTLPGSYYATNELQQALRKLDGEKPAALIPLASPRRLTPPSKDTVIEPLLSGADFLYGACSLMREVARLVERVAPFKTSVLILGESGVGKELIAKALHNCSDRTEKPWIPVNCAAIPPSLAESQLFGYVKGAFTDAREDRPGFFESAHTGTLFLDEVGDLPLDVQAKLLRLLNDGMVVRVGSSPPGRKVDVRVIAATNRDLRAMESRGQFRLDFFARMSGFIIRVPPLHERDAEAVLLARRHLRNLLTHETDGNEFARLSCAAELSHDFEVELLRRLRSDDERLRFGRGNVRELKQFVEYCAIMTDTPEIGPEHFDAWARDRY